MDGHNADKEMEIAKDGFLLQIPEKIYENYWKELVRMQTGSLYKSKGG